MRNSEYFAALEAEGKQVKDSAHLIHVPNPNDVPPAPPIEAAVSADPAASPISAPDLSGHGTTSFPRVSVSDSNSLLDSFEKFLDTIKTPVVDVERIVSAIEKSAINFDSLVKEIYHAVKQANVDAFHEIAAYQQAQKSAVDSADSTIPAGESTVTK